MQGKMHFIWKLFWLCLLLICGFIIYKLFANSIPTKPHGFAQPLAPVRTAKAYVQDVPYFLNGLGTVLPSSDILVKSRVTGQLIRLHFQEGQHVRAGQLLAEIDPRPFQAALNEAKGKLSADTAQLENAKRDLERYSSLIQGDYVERQKYDTQKALVLQYTGAVATDKAQVETARLQLEYSRITAPASGIVGLRKVDVGNQISTTDTTGIVRITEVSPCDVLFTLPETELPKIMRSVREFGKYSALPVEAWDREQREILAHGNLLSIDNEIDRETGTIRLKARFANKNRILYANQFVNARIRITVLKQAVTVPAAAIQVGPKGHYVYVFKEQKQAGIVPNQQVQTKTPHQAKTEAQSPIGNVELREVKVGLETPRLVQVKSGLLAEEEVVVDGLDRLKDGLKVRVAATVPTPLAEPIK